MSTTLKILTATDLHRSRNLYALLAEAVHAHQPDLVALVGDFLHGFPYNIGRMSNEACARALSRLPCAEVLFVRGNHEDEAWEQFVREWRRHRPQVRALHGEVFVHGPLAVVGFPCLLGTEDAFIAPRLPLPVDPAEWLPAVLRPWGRAARTLWLMHEPPAGTPLSEAGSMVAGNLEWNWAIERFAPWLVICGHDHLTPQRSRCWFHQLGDTLCVNVGQTEDGPLHHCLIEVEFERAGPTLPKRLRVTAFPFHEGIELPAHG